MYRKKALRGTCALVLLSAVSCSAADSLSLGNAYEGIWRFHGAIAGLRDGCKPDTLRSPVLGGRIRVIPCGGEEGNMVAAAVASAPSADSIARISSVLPHLRHFLLSVNERKSASSTLNDTTILRIFIVMLSDTTEASGRIPWMLADDLTYRTLRPLLKRNGRLLLDALRLGRLSLEPKRRLACLSGLPRNQIEGVVDLANATLPERARLGDRAAEDSLVAAYDRARGYRDKARLVEELAYTGTRKCLSHLILHFNEPVFAIVGTNNCVNKTIRSSIVHALVPYHPEAGVLNARLRDMRTVCDSAVVEQYCDDFIAWADSTYGVRPVDPRPPHGILENYCTVDMDRPGQYIGCRERARWWPKRTPSR